jgi:hypothetical protein
VNTYQNYFTLLNKIATTRLVTPEQDCESLSWKFLLHIALAMLFSEVRYQEEQEDAEADRESAKEAVSGLSTWWCRADFRIHFM